MEHKPRWAEMCARILQQCEVVEGGRENLARHLGVHPYDLGLWLSAKSGPPRPFFALALELILPAHARGARAEAAGRLPRRRSHERQ